MLVHARLRYEPIHLEFEGKSHVQGGSNFRDLNPTPCWQLRGHLEHGNTAIKSTAISCTAANGVSRDFLGGSFSYQRRVQSNDDNKDEA